MDAALIRKLLDKTLIEDLRKYLEVYNSDAEAIQGMIGAEMLRYMASCSTLSFGDQYAEALKIREYNLKPGTQTDFFNCQVCRNKGHLLDISEDGYLVTRICKCQVKRSVIANAERSNMGGLIKKEVFKRRIDGAIAGRIKEQCGVNFVTVSLDPAKNWRLKGCV